MSVAKASNRLQSLEAIIADEIMKRSKDDFLERFMICECVYKNLLKSYDTKQGQKRADKDLRLNLGEIKKVLKYFDVQFDDSVIEMVFSGSGKYRLRGTMSAKKLRDSIVHNMNEPSIREVHERYEELMAAMASFLYPFRKQTV